MYGKGIVTDQMCQKWFAKFHAGDFSLDDALPLGRPVEVDSNQIETFIENSQPLYHEGDSQQTHNVPKQ